MEDVANNPEPSVEISIDKPRRRYTNQVFEPRTCESCGDQFVPVKKEQRFCSVNCRANHFYHQKKNSQMAGTSAQPAQSSAPAAAPSSPIGISRALPPINDIPAHAQYVINAQHREIEEYRDAHRKAQDTVEKLKSDIERLKLELVEKQHEIENVKNQKPSGLNGLMENPAMKDLVPFIGPGLGKIVDNLADKLTGTAPAIQAQESQQNPLIQSINEWFIDQPDHVQQSVFGFMNDLARIEQAQLVGRITAAHNALNQLQPQPNKNANNFRFANY